MDSISTTSSLEVHKSDSSEGEEMEEFPPMTEKNLYWARTSSSELSSDE